MNDSIKLVGVTDVVEREVDLQRRSQNCIVDIQNILKRWNCAINPVVEISGRGVGTRFEVIALEVVPKT